MAKFFVGQRVKKVRGPCSVGITGVVAEVDASDERGLGVRLDAGIVGFLIDGSPAARSSGEIAWDYPEYWEPILPDGNRAGDYSLSELLDRCRQGITEAA